LVQNGCGQDSNLKSLDPKCCTLPCDH